MKKIIIKAPYTNKEATFDILLHHEVLDLSLREIQDRWNWGSDFRVRKLLKFLIEKKTISYENGKYTVNYVFKKVGREAKQPAAAEGNKKEKKPKAPPHPAFKPLMELYFDWHENFIKEGKPVIQPQDGKGLNTIIKILESRVKEKKPDYTTEDLLAAFDVVLQNYEFWDSFQKKQITLSRIATNLESIIIQIKTVASGKQVNSKNRTEFYNQIIRDAFQNLQTDGDRPE